jgi:hypothetical protein
MSDLVVNHTSLFMTDLPSVLASAVHARVRIHGDLVSAEALVPSYRDLLETIAVMVKEPFILRWKRHDNEETFGVAVHCAWAEDRVGDACLGISRLLRIRMNTAKRGNMLDPEEFKAISIVMDTLKMFPLSTHCEYGFVHPQSRPERWMWVYACVHN